MSQAAVVAQNLSKSYALERKAERPDSFRDAIVEAVASPFRRFRQLSGRNSTQEDFWALRDVSFEVQPGEVVAIIGRNGSGKSTLLKILSRIVEPTHGKAVLRGRVASLLEVGTGFHAELSGRENIYLNGSIMGMKKREIESKFDEIVAFAEVERFLETPVKRYSSGMYVRLAFAVAAHLEPEILIVDEVLAVGDSEFQKKCLGKMREVAENGGRTVLFVSHNMSAVTQLCTKAILLEQGEKQLEGKTSEVVDRYLARITSASSESLLANRIDRQGKGTTQFRRIELLDANGNSTASPMTGRPLRLSFQFTQPVRKPVVVFTIYDSLGNAITCFDSSRAGPNDIQQESGVTQNVICEMEELLLVSGRYRINAQLSVQGEMEDRIEGAISFYVESGSVRGRITPNNSSFGSLDLPHRWTAT